MAISYQKELDFTVSVLTRLRLAVHMLHPGDLLSVLDAGLRAVIGMPGDYSAAYHTATSWSQHRTIYKVLDQFMCNYIYFHLPETETPTAVVIGPYLTMDLTREMLLEQTERLGLGMQQVEPQAEFYASLPVFNDPQTLLSVLACLGDAMWGGPENFHMVDVNYDQRHSIPGAHQAGQPIEQVDVLQQMKQLEERYAYEDELMEIVAKGLTNRAELMMSNVSQLNFQNRSADPLRNIKNYCVICNTLLRKAAQTGGVHPLYLDKASSQWAQQIEASPTVEKANGLIGDMIRGYCRLVHKHTGRNYTATVQKALAYIETNLSGDLSLGTLAGQMKVSPGYLSSLFHRETGTTLVEHIAARRMKAALQLLKTTRLQISTVAQLTGFADPNYFGKLFKRHYGLTPLQYRKEQLGRE